MNFDRVAPCYQIMERVAAGGRLRKCRVEFLDRIPEPQRVLLLGEGRGMFLAECLKRFPEARFMVVDSSRVMLAHAREMVAERDLPRVVFQHADVVDWQPPNGEFDLLVTHFFLDCFSPQTLAAIIPKLGAAASQDARWLVSDFQIANGRFASIRSRWILWLLYRFFRISCKLEALSLTPPEPFLLEAGFRLEARREFDWGLLKSECWRL